MSYDKLKYVSIKDNKVFLTVASNNLTPQRYEKCEYLEKSNFSLEHKLFELCKDMIQGNIQPISSCNMQLKEKVDRESNQYLNVRNEYKYIGEFGMMNPYSDKDMINLYNKIQTEILSFRAIVLLNNAFKDVKELEYLPDKDYFNELDKRIDKTFFSGKEETRIQNLKDRTKDILFALCQTAPKIGLDDMVSYFGDYDVYEVPLDKTEKEVWDSVVEKLKEIGKSEQFKDKSYSYYANNLATYPPTYENINETDTYLKILTNKGNMVDKYKEALKQKEIDDLEEEQER